MTLECFNKNLVRIFRIKSALCVSLSKMWAVAMAFDANKNMFMF